MTNYIVKLMPKPHPLEHPTFMSYKHKKNFLKTDK
jgi:hypothetical protein